VTCSRSLTGIAADGLTDFVAAQEAGGSSTQEWEAVFGATAFPTGLGVDAIVVAVEGTSDASAFEDDNSGLTIHIEHALHWRADHVDQTPDHARSAKDAAAFGLSGPGNIAYRSLSRILSDHDTVSAPGLWSAAAIISAGFRTLFNRPDIQRLIDNEYGTTDPYWQRLLKVCADGNLQAVLDEYLHHVRNNEFSGPIGDDTLTRLATTAQQAMSLRPATYQLFDPSNPAEPIRMPARFAIRYGSKNEKRQDNDAVRLPEVREAFNSPFWPYVLATTSVGQEGPSCPDAGVTVVVCGLGCWSG
jgi:hypothetical protein